MLVVCIKNHIRKGNTFRFEKGKQYEYQITERNDHKKSKMFLVFTDKSSFYGFDYFFFNKIFKTVKQLRKEKLIKLESSNYEIRNFKGR